MKMKNLVSFFAATTVVLSMGAFSVSAAVENGMSLEYVASDVATERIVKVYYAGTETPTSGISGANIQLNVEGATVEAVTYTLPDSTGDVKFDTPEAPTCDDGVIFINLVAGGRVTAANQELITFVLTVPEGTGEFTVSVDTAESYMFDGLNEEWFIECEEESITIPALGGGKDDFTPVTAVEGDVYDADKTTVPVKVWSTEIDYSTTEVKGKLVWAVKNAEGGVAKVDATTVSGDATVVYGIAIAGQAAELETIKSVELTVE